MTALPKTNPSPPAAPRSKWVSLGVLILLLVVLYVPAVINAIWFRDFDYPTHISWAQSMVANGQFHPGGVIIDDVYYRANHLFQLLVAGIAYLPGITFNMSGLIVGVTANVATGVIVFLLLWAVLPGQDRWWHSGLGIGLTLILLLVGPLTFFSWDLMKLYIAYLTPHVYHNPTVTLLKPLALLQFIAAVRCFDPRFTGKNGHAQNGRGIILGAAVVTVLALYAKPNYILCLLPVVGLLLVLQLARREPVDWRLAVFGIILPAVLVLAMQYLFRFASDDPNSIIWAPFRSLLANGAQRILFKLGLSMMFPVSVTLLYLRRASRDTALIIAWLTFVVSLPFTYLLAESMVPADMNFIWGSQVTLFILFVVTARFLMQQVVDYGDRSWRMWLNSALLAAHFVCGILWYAVEVFTTEHYW